jgi:hypothetical protein
VRMRGSSLDRLSHDERTIRKKVVFLMGMRISGWVLRSLEQGRRQ